MAWGPLPYKRNMLTSKENKSTITPIGEQSHQHRWVKVSHLRVADDIVVISDSLKRAGTMIKELKDVQLRRVIFLIPSAWPHIWRRHFNPNQNSKLQRT